MANNRLYIVDTTTGDKFLLCKSFGYDWGVFRWWTMKQMRATRIPVIGRIIDAFLWAQRMRDLEEWLESRDTQAVECGGRNSTLKLKTEYEIPNG